MKLCERPGCKFPRVFFSKSLNLKVCLHCKITYHSQVDFKRIHESKQAKEVVDAISHWLGAIRSHSRTYSIEDLFRGFEGELRDFEQKTEEIRRRLADAEDQDKVDEIKKIEKEAFELKRQLDSSEMMHNFAINRLQITMDCTVRGIMNEEMRDETQVKRLMTLAKENMVQDFERRYEERYNRRNEKLRRKYEEQYRDLMEGYKWKIDQQDVTIKTQQREIRSIKDEAIEKDSKMDKLVEESKKIEAKLELERKSTLGRFFEFYKAKT